MNLKDDNIRMNRKEGAGGACRTDRGVTLIELIIGMSVLLVVGLMVAQLFGSSIRMYHSTIFYSDVQTESQAVCRRLEDAVMNASNIYLKVIDGTADAEKAGAEKAGAGTGEETAQGGTIFFTGELVGEEPDISYEGTLFWFNQSTGRLYQKSNAHIRLSAVEGTKTGDPTAKTLKDPGKAGDADTEKRLLEDLSEETVKAEMENAGNLISDKVKALNFTITPGLTKEDRVPGKENYYMLDQKITVGFNMTFNYLGSGDYPVQSSATPRNRVEKLRWPAADEVETGEN